MSVNFSYFFLGSPPSIEKPYSSYPLLVTPNSQPSKRTLVVQDFTFGKYLGHLKLKFDQAGNVINHTGNPILLDNRFPKDPDVLSHVQNMSSHVRKYSRVSKAAQMLLICHGHIT